MFRRRTVMSLAVTVVLVAGCRLFKPVNPNPQPERPAEEQAPAATSTDSAAQPAAPAEAAPAPEAAPATARDPGAMKDRNIAAMVLAFNNTDISYARLAPARAERADVKDFARRMLTDHTSLNSAMNDLLAKLDVAPEDNNASLDLRDESAANRDRLRDLSGHAFDSTYVENEVRYHREYLSALDELMVPRAQNADLRTLLSGIRPAVAAHLAHAEQVRADVLAKKR